jgi:hypothetical protein
VDSQVDLASENGAIEFLGEKALVSNARKGDVANAVAGRLDNDDLDSALRVELLNACAGMFGLPERQCAAARSDA